MRNAIIVSSILMCVMFWQIGILWIVIQMSIPLAIGGRIGLLLLNWIGYDLKLIDYELNLVGIIHEK